MRHSPAPTFPCDRSAESGCTEVSCLLQPGGDKLRKLSGGIFHNHSISRLLSCCCNNLLLLPRTKGAQRACCRLRIFIESTVTIFADQNQFVRSLARGASTRNLGRDMHANTKPTTAPGDDGAPASEESAQMKINNQLLLDYKTPVRTPTLTTAHPSAPLGRHASGCGASQGPPPPSTRPGRPQAPSPAAAAARRRAAR